ncbi:hypothetical protein BDV93DRAFT_515752 [Ceratobasidium sp. AG-I]|nr:hypothetical protein BDV93DRAFT_515752 [Ceratobasidium sp. AG-I]
MYLTLSACRTVSCALRPSVSHYLSVLANTWAGLPDPFPNALRAARIAHLGSGWEWLCALPAPTPRFPGTACLDAVCGVALALQETVLAMSLTRTCGRARASALKVVAWTGPSQSATQTTHLHTPQLPRPPSIGPSTQTSPDHRQRNRSGYLAPRYLASIVSAGACGALMCPVPLQYGQEVKLSCVKRTPTQVQNVLAKDYVRNDMTRAQCGGGVTGGNQTT